LKSQPLKSAISQPVGQETCKNRCKITNFATGSIVEEQILPYLFIQVILQGMTIEQTVEIPVDHRLTLEIPFEIPAGRTILALTLIPVSAAMPVVESTITSQLAKLKTCLADNSPRTTEEALQQAAERLADPNRKPISRHFGTHKGILGGDGVVYQRKIRDEWD
jgi:hypothetical protein